MVHQIRRCILGPVGIGPFTDGGNMAIFKTREEAEAFSREDPFLLEGIVKSFVIKEWRDSLLPGETDGHETTRCTISR